MFDVPELSLLCLLFPWFGSWHVCGVPCVWRVRATVLVVIVTSLFPFPGHGAASLLIPWKQIMCVGKTENESEFLKEIFKSLEERVLPLIFTEFLLCGSASCAPAGRWMRSSSSWLWRDVADSPTQSSLIKHFLKGFRNNELRWKIRWAERIGNGCNRNLNVGYEIKNMKEALGVVLPFRLSLSQVCQQGCAQAPALLLQGFSGSSRVAFFSTQCSPNSWVWFSYKTEFTQILSKHQNAPKCHFCLWVKLPPCTWDTKSCLNFINSLIITCVKSQQVLSPELTLF